MNYSNICGPRAFSLKAISIQRKAGMTWFEILCDWIAMYLTIPIEVARGEYSDGVIPKISGWLMRGAIRRSSELGYYGWWGLPPNWAAKWSARKAWGNQCP
jgi:hypothetical protein